MSKITQKEYKKEFIEIKKYFDLDFFGTIENKNSINTKWGLYKFYFDKNSIFGKFEDLKVNLIPDKFQAVNGKCFEIVYYPNLNSRKMNFHFEQIFDFIDTIDRIAIYEDEKIA